MAYQQFVKLETSNHYKSTSLRAIFLLDLQNPNITSQKYVEEKGWVKFADKLDALYQRVYRQRRQVLNDDSFSIYFLFYCRFNSFIIYQFDLEFTAVTN